MIHNRQAQSLQEYVMVVMVMVMAVMALMPMLRRGAQSMIKSGADVIGEQKSAEQDFDSSYLKGSTTISKVSGGVSTTAGNEATQQSIDETTNTDARSTLYLGSTEDE